MMLFTGLAIITPRLAHAADPATAERLFREGRTALQAGQLEQACANFEESQRLDPSAGTVLNLADCYERRGQLADALVSYREAAKEAQTRGRKDWVETATTRAASLEKRVPVLVIKVLPAEALRIDVHLEDRKHSDVVIPAKRFDTEIPVSPGEHTIRATAPNREPWSTSITIPVGAVRTVTVVDIPPLTQVQRGGGDDPARSSRYSSDDGSSQKTIGLIVGGVGVGGLVLGVISGAIASTALGDAKAGCVSYPTRCSVEGDADNSRAKTFALVSTVSLIAGGALAIGGAVLYFTAAPSRSSSSTFGVGFGLGAQGGFVRGVF